MAAEPTEDVAAAARVPRFVGPNLRARRRGLVQGASPVVRMMIGDAIGDAFGFGIEAQDAYWIRANVYIEPKWPRSPVLPFGFRVPGFYSDDAEMTVALMKGLVASGVGIDEDGMLKAWRDEWELAKQRPPPATPTDKTARHGHGSISRFFRGGSIDDVREMQRSKDDPGNAPPMRSLPLAFFRDADRQRLCAANANATHPHPKAVAASFVVATAARHLLVDGGDKSAVFDVALASLRASSLSEPATEAHLKRVAALPDYHTFGPRFEGMPPHVHELLCGPQPCPHAVQFKIPAGADGMSPMYGMWTDAMRTAAVVLYLVRFHRGARDVLLRSVDIGGDVDSVAALCLGIVAGSDGLPFGDGPDDLPWFFVETLEGVEYLVAEATRFEEWLVANGHLSPRHRL